MTSTPPAPELSDLPPAPVPPAVVAHPPAMPPRPMSPRQQAKVTLKEAFPTVDDSVIDAVLIASGGNIEPAFNALLGKSSPLLLSLRLPPVLHCESDSAVKQ